MNQLSNRLWVFGLHLTLTWGFKIKANSNDRRGSKFRKFGPTCYSNDAVNELIKGLSSPY